MKRLILFLVIIGFLAVPPAWAKPDAKDAKDARIRLLKATVEEQARQIRKLRKQIKLLRAEAADNLNNSQATTKPKTVPAKVAKVALRRKSKKLNFRNTPFTDVIEKLRKDFDLQIFVKWKQLAGVGIGPDQPVNLSLSDVTLEAAIKLILEDVGTAQSKLSYEIDGGILTISTSDDLDGKMVTRTYDVTSLLAIRRRGETRADKAKELISMIKTSVSPVSWEQPGAAIQFMSNKLIITQSKRYHAAISRLLQQMRLRS